MHFESHIHENAHVCAPYHAILTQVDTVLGPCRPATSRACESFSGNHTFAKMCTQDSTTINIGFEIVQYLQSNTISTTEGNSFRSTMPLSSPLTHIHKGVHGVTTCPIRSPNKLAKAASTRTARYKAIHKAIQDAPSLVRHEVGCCSC